METDSPTTKAQKARLREQIEVGFSIRLADWFVEGATLVDLREIQKVYRRAHERYMTEGVPTADEPVKPLRFHLWLSLA